MNMSGRIAGYITGKTSETYHLTDTISRDEFVENNLIPSMGEMSSQLCCGVKGIELYILKPRFYKCIMNWHDFEKYVNQDTDEVDFEGLKSELKERVKSTLDHPDIKDFQTLYKGACLVNTGLE